METLREIQLGLQRQKIHFLLQCPSCPPLRSGLVQVRMRGKKRETEYAVLNL